MKVVEVAIALIAFEGRWFLQRRDPAGPVLPGLWEFPGGKVEPGESPEAACLRELSEELGMSSGALRFRDRWIHAYPDRQVVLHAFEAEASGSPRTELAWGWFAGEEIRRLPTPEANAALIASLR